MHDLQLYAALRNVLLVQLLLIGLAPEFAFQVYHHFLKIWKAFHVPSLPKKDKKRSRFWEIDMTNFEP